MNRKSKILGIALSTAVAMPLAVSSVATAQELEEITVTAQKREQDIMDVPIAITALDENAVNDLRILSPKDLADAVPGMSVGGRAAGSSPTFTIRGLGFNGGAIGSQAVSVNIDEVSFSNGLYSVGSTYDIARVEVLKGPQGDLYGRNTTGGAMNFVSNKPSAEKEVMLQLGYGNFQAFESQGVLNGAISDSVNARFAWQSNDRREGFQTNWLTGEELGKASRIGARLQFDVAASDRLNVLFNVHGFSEDSDNVGKSNIGVSPDAAADGYPDTDAYPEVFSPDPTNPFLVSWEDDPTNCNMFGTGCRTWGGKPMIKHDSFGASIRLDFDINDSMTLTSLTAYEELERSRIDDDDGSYISEYEQFQNNELDMFTQEIRLTAQPTDKFSWLAGVFYSEDYAYESRVVDAFEYFVYSNGGLVFVFDTMFKQKSDSAGVFAHAEYSFNDQWTLIGGIRFTKESKNIYDAGAINVGEMADDIANAFFGTTDPAILEAIGWNCFVEGFRDGGLISGNIVLQGVPGVECYEQSDTHSSLSDDDPSGKVVLVYQPNENHTGYLSLARGFKSGGFNSGNLVYVESIAANRPEKVDAFELGWKARLAEGRVATNLALFHYDFFDRQIGGAIWDPFFGTAVGLNNVEESRVQGGELELTVRPIDSLEWYVGYSYVDAKTIKHSGYSRAAAEALPTGIRSCSIDGTNPGSGPYVCNVIVDFAGERLDIRPWHFTTRLSYTWDLGSMDLRAAFDYSKRPDQPDYQGTGTFNPGYGTTGANVLLSDKDSRWDAQLWVRNLSDQVIIGNSSSNEMLQTTMANRPREYGVRATFYWQ